MVRTSKTNKNIPKATKPLVSCSKHALIPKIRIGSTKYMFAMNNNGKLRHLRVIWPILRPVFNTARLIIGVGYHRIIPVTLKNKWTNAICNASTLDDTMAASKAVIVVPISAPIINGYICSRFNIPNPAKGTKLEEVIDDDCTNTVTAAPIKIPKYGLIFVD